MSAIRTEGPTAETTDLFDNYHSGDDPSAILAHVRADTNASGYLEKLRELYLSYHSDQENADLYCASVISGNEVKEETDWYVDNENWEAMLPEADALVTFVRYCLGYEIEL